MTCGELCHYTPIVAVEVLGCFALAARPHVQAISFQLYMAAYRRHPVCYSTCFFQASFTCGTYRFCFCMS